MMSDGHQAAAECEESDRFSVQPRPKLVKRSWKGGSVVWSWRVVGKEPFAVGLQNKDSS